MWQTERTPGRSSSSPAPLAASSLAAAPCPTWNAAVTQVSVNRSVEAQLQSIVQPRLDSFAERLGGIVAEAQRELRELERTVERTEARLESRLSSLEARAALLADGASKTEQRERDLNTRIAGIAGGLLKGAEDAALDATREHRFDSFERTMQAKLDRSEESTRKSLKSMQRLEQRLAEVEDFNLSFSDLAEELRTLAATIRPLTGSAGSVTSNSDDSTPELSERLSALEVQVETLTSLDNGTEFQALRDCIERQRMDMETLARQMLQNHEELRTQLGDQEYNQAQVQENPIGRRTEQDALAARLDELNLRVGSLKVKAEGLESRLQTGLERADRADRPSSAPVLADKVEECCSAISSEIGPRLEVLEARLNNWEDAWEEADKADASEPLFPSTRLLERSSFASLDRVVNVATAGRGLHRGLVDKLGAAGRLRRHGFGTPAQAQSRGEFSSTAAAP